MFNFLNKNKNKNKNINRLPPEVTQSDLYIPYTEIKERHHGYEAYTSEEAYQIENFRRRTLIKQAERKKLRSVVLELGFYLVLLGLIAKVYGVQTENLMKAVVDQKEVFGVVELQEALEEGLKVKTSFWWQLLHNFVPFAYGGILIGKINEINKETQAKINMYESRFDRWRESNYGKWINNKWVNSGKLVWMIDQIDKIDEEDKEE